MVTQNDIRQIQLAKAALYAGVKLLMDRMGVTSVDRIRLAGAFGSHISVSHAMVLGLILIVRWTLCRRPVMPRGSARE